MDSFAVESVWTIQIEIDYLCQKNIEVASLSSQVSYREQQEVCPFCVHYVIRPTFSFFLF